MGDLRDAHLFRMPGHRSHCQRHRARVGRCRRRALSDRDQTRAGVDHRLDRARCPAAAGRLRDCAAGSRCGCFKPNTPNRPDKPYRYQRIASPPHRGECPLSTLQLDAHPAAIALRFDTLQGAVSLRRLPRAVRLFQAALIVRMNRRIRGRPPRPRFKHSRAGFSGDPCCVKGQWIPAQLPK